MITTFEKVLLLKGVDFFAAIPGEDLADIAQIALEVERDEGEALLREGDAADALYLIAGGLVRVQKGDRKLADLGEGEVFGEMGLLDPAPRSASVIALTDVALLRIDREAFADIMAGKPEIARGIINVLTRRLREASR